MTTILLILFAAGLVTHGVHEFVEAGAITVGTGVAFDISAVLPHEGMSGMALLGGFLGSLILDILLAHSENQFRRESEYVPLAFSAVATVTRLGTSPPTAAMAPTTLRNSRRPTPIACRWVSHA